MAQIANLGKILFFMSPSGCLFLVVSLYICLSYWRGCGTDCGPELPDRAEAVRGQLAGAAEGGLHRPRPVCRGK